MGYVMQYMTHRDGGIFSAEDADSYENANSKHKKEGAFYVWTKTEIEQVSFIPYPLSSFSLSLTFFPFRFWERMQLCFHTITGLSQMGMWKREGIHTVSSRGKISFFIYWYLFLIASLACVAPNPLRILSNFIFIIVFDFFLHILAVRHTIAETAAHFKLEPAHVQSILKNSRKALLVERNNRPRPHLDDKIITAWNGLMISAFAKGYAILGKNEYLQVRSPFFSLPPFPFLIFSSLFFFYFIGCSQSCRIHQEQFVQCRDADSDAKFP